MSSKSGDPQLVEISGKLDLLIALNALSVVRDIKVQKDQIALLSDAGMGPKQIARLLQTSENTVKVALHRLRKEREKQPLAQEDPAPLVRDLKPQTGGAQ